MIWKLEDVADESSRELLDDVGPAWIRRPGTQAAVQIQDGRWITREEARELARENGYTLTEDDGRGVDATLAAQPQTLDARRINRELRQLGISASELTVDRTLTDDVRLTGSLVDRLRSHKTKNAEGGFVYSTVSISMPLDEAFVAIAKLVPDWRPSQ